MLGLPEESGLAAGCDSCSRDRDRQTSAIIRLIKRGTTRIGWGRSGARRVPKGGRGGSTNPLQMLGNGHGRNEQ